MNIPKSDSCSRDWGAHAPSRVPSGALAARQEGIRTYETVITSHAPQRSARAPTAARVGACAPRINRMVTANIMKVRVGRFIGQLMILALLCFGKAASAQTTNVELVQNGNLQAAVNGEITLPGWSIVAERGSESVIALETTHPLNDGTTNSLRLTVKKSTGRAGVANSGAKGMTFKEGAWYDLTFYARTEANKHFGLPVSLESRDGRNICAWVTIPEVGGAWRKYTLALQARKSIRGGRMVIGMPDTGTIWLTAVSLVRREPAPTHD